MFLKKKKHLDFCGVSDRSTVIEGKLLDIGHRLGKHSYLLLGRSIAIINK